MPPPRFTPQELDELASQVPFVKAWLKAVEEVLDKALGEGTDLKNVHLVPTQARRYWSLEGDALLTRLRKFSKLDVVAPRVPLSPAQAEKTLGKKLFAAKLSEFTVRKSSGMKLAYSNEETENEED